MHFLLSCFLTRATVSVFWSYRVVHTGTVGWAWELVYTVLWWKRFRSFQFLFRPHSGRVDSAYALQQNDCCLIPSDIWRSCCMTFSCLCICLKVVFRLSSFLPPTKNTTLSHPFVPSCPLSHVYLLLPSPSYSCFCFLKKPLIYRHLTTE